MRGGPRCTAEEMLARDGRVQAAGLSWALSWAWSTSKPCLAASSRAAFFCRPEPVPMTVPSTARARNQQQETESVSGGDSPTHWDVHCVAWRGPV